jgi:hypothetical protein
MRTRAMAILLAATLAACGGDGGGAPRTAQNGGSEGGTATTQCRTGSRVVVSVFVDGSDDRFYGMQTRLRYPASLAIPGHADDQSVADRVRFVVAMPIVRLDVPEETFVNGSTVVNDEDTDFDGIDDRLQASLITAHDAFPDGKFIDVTFDCAETIDWPTADAFGCEVADLTDLDRMSVQGLCWVVVQPPATS